MRSSQRVFAGRTFRAVTTVTAIATLAACGGGGGGSSSSSTSAAQPSSVDTRNGDKIRLGGIVSKGLLGNANVYVRAIKSDGTVDEASTPLATGTTSSTGSYSTSEFTISGAYVVEVAARDCADPTATVNTSAPTCSYHQDEELGQAQYLPTGFKIRAIVTATPADNTVNVTLFSELAIRAAINAAGGLTSGNMAKAQAMVNNLFGTTDLNTVVPKSLPVADDTETTSGTNTLTAAESRLAAMLAAASKIAGVDTRLQALLAGISTVPSTCSDVTAGTPAATQCVLDVLANNANINTYVGNDTDVTSTLNSALQKVVTDSGSAELAAVTSTTSDKLTNTSLSVPAPADDSGAYTAIRNFFSDLVNTARTLFTSTDGETLLKQARAFETAGNNLIFTGQTLISDGTALEMAVELWHNYDLNPSTAPVTRFQHRTMTDPTFVNSGHHCKLQKAVSGGFQDIVNGETPDRAVCFADFSYTYSDTAIGTSSGTPYNAIRVSHAFWVSRTSATAYSYVSTAIRDFRAVTLNWPAESVTSDSLVDRYWIQTNDGSTVLATNTTSIPSNVVTFSGTLTAAFSGSDLSSVAISGQVPDGIQENAYTVVHATTTNNQAYGQLSTTVTGTNVNSTSPTLSFTGSLVAYAGDGSTHDFDLDFTDGYVAITNETAQRIKFSATLVTGADKFAGSVDANRIAAGSTGSDGGTIQFTGALYNTAASGSSTVPFIQASLTYKQDNTNYVDTAAFSTSNFQLHALTFDGFITAPSSPRLRVALTAAGKQVTQSYDFGLDNADAVSGDYFIYTDTAGTSLKRDVTFTFKAADNNTTGKAQVTSEVVDPTNKISFTFASRTTVADVLVNKIKRAVLDVNTGSLPRVDLSNGEYFSLDMGTVQY